jgi:hypothetical protein
MCAVQLGAFEGPAFRMLAVVQRERSIFQRTAEWHLSMVRTGYVEVLTTGGTG